jgi:hypothetical protein
LPRMANALNSFNIFDPPFPMIDLDCSRFLTRTRLSSHRDRPIGPSSFSAVEP